MWATNNSHEALVKILLEHGASSQTKSAKGRTVFDFINTDNQKIIEILATNPRDSVSSTSSLFYKTTSSVSSSTSSTENDFYYQSTAEGFNNFMSEEAELRQKLFESTMQLDFDDTDSVEHNHAEQDEQDDNEHFDENQFHWDKCSPDQMFVFNSDDLDSILDTIITHIQLPLAKQQDICVPTNIIFLSARFAHYFSSSELLEQVLEGALSRIRKTIKVILNCIMQSICITLTGLLDKCSQHPRFSFLDHQFNATIILPQKGRWFGRSYCRATIELVRIDFRDLQLDHPRHNKETRQSAMPGHAGSRRDPWHGSGGFH